MPFRPGRRAAPPIRVVVHEPGFVVSRPCFSPDGARVLFMRARADGDAARVANSDASPWGLWLAPVTGGTPTLVFAPARGAATRPDWDRRSGRIAFTLVADGRAELWLAESIGAIPGPLRGEVTDLPRLYYPSWLPDGERLVVTDLAANRLLIVDAGNGSVTPATEPLRVWPGVASVRGGAAASLVFAGQAPSAERDVRQNRLWIGVPGGEVAELDRAPGRMPQWSPDGRRLAFAAARGPIARLTGRGRSRVFLLEVDVSGVAHRRARAVTESRWNAAHPKWSPSGDLITVQCDVGRVPSSAIAVVGVPR